MSFGFSIGDFLAVGKLVKDISHCLADKKGSAAEYQELLRELDCLQQALLHLDNLPYDTALSAHLDSIKCAALSCRYPLEQFLHKIQKYDTTLGVWRKSGTVKSTVDKLRWSLSQKEEGAKLQSYINVHIGTINILLAQHGLKTLALASDRAAADQLDIQERLAQTHGLVQQCNVSLASHMVMAQNTQGMLAKLCKMMSGELMTSWRILGDTVARICISTQQMYAMLHDIKASLAGPDTRWTFFQAPLLVEDALGRRFPVPSEYDFGLLDAVIKQKFITGPGSTDVLDSHYEYFKTKDSNTVISRTSRLLPGMAITMAVIVARPKSMIETCPIAGCQSSDITNPAGGGRTCLECNVWFSTSSKKLRCCDDILSDFIFPDSANTDTNMSAENTCQCQRKSLSLTEDDAPVFKNLRLYGVDDARRPYLDSTESLVSTLPALSFDMTASTSSMDNISLYRETVESDTERQLSLYPCQTSSVLTENFRKSHPALQYERKQLSLYSSQASSTATEDLRKSHPALQYARKVTTQYQQSPETYKNFRDILRIYQPNATSLKDVAQEIENLFEEDPELFHEFKRFLPESLRRELM